MRAVIFCGLMMLLTHVAWSSETTAPSRPLRAGEELALQVAGARRILVGHIVSRYDTLYDLTVARFPPVLRAAGVVTFQPIRVLRGGAVRDPFRFIEWSSRHAFSTDERAGDRGVTFEYPRSEPLIVFLEDLDERPRMTEDRGISRWASKPLAPNWSDEFEREVRAEVSRQSPEGLIASAERIVLAHPQDREHFLESKSWIVDRTLRGEPVGFVNVREVLPTAAGRSPALLFLRKVDDAYEPVRLGGGIVDVQGKRVPAWNCSLDQAIHRIANAKP